MWKGGNVEKRIMCISKESIAKRSNQGDNVECGIFN